MADSSHARSNASPTASPARLSLGIWILALIALVMFLRTASSLLIPIALAVLISYGLEPIVAWLERHRVPRVAGTGLLLVVLAGGAGLAVHSFADDAARAIESLPDAARKIRETVSGQSGTIGKVKEAAGELSGMVQGQPTLPGGERTQGTSGGPGGGASAGSGQPAPRGAAPGQTGAGLGSAVQRGATTAADLLGHITVIAFLVCFLLIYSGHFKQRVLEIAGARSRRRVVTRQILDEIDRQVARFILVRVATSAIVGVATWLVLAWMGVGQAAVWGLLAGVFNSIPYFGPVIVSGGLVVVGLAQYGDAAMALKMAGAALVITSVEGWVITPLLIGEAERMHPLVVFLGLLVWSWIWGIWGTILAVPMLAVLKSICDHVDELKPVGRLLAK